MPIARTDLIKGEPTSTRRTIGNTVCQAMVDALKASAADRFYVPFTFGVSACAAGHLVEIVYIIDGG
jgi:hypothetical protein